MTALKAEPDTGFNFDAVQGIPYKKAGLYFEQVRAYLEAFDEVKVFLFEDLVSAPQNLMRELYQFIGADPDFQPEFRKYNVTGKPKNKALRGLHAVIYSQGPIQSWLKVFVGALKLGGFVNRLKHWISSAESEKTEMPAEARAYLKDYYREDILKLQSLLNRDLSAWL